MHIKSDANQANQNETLSDHTSNYTNHNLPIGQIHQMSTTSMYIVQIYIILHQSQSSYLSDPSDVNHLNVHCTDLYHITPITI
jgi:hypothetical protein